MRWKFLVLLACLSCIACSSIEKKDMDPANLHLQELLSKKSSADARKQLSKIKQLKQDNYTQYEQAKLFYTIAMLERDWEANKKAQHIFEQLLADKNFIRPAYRHAELQAYYGSLYTLKGRDMPGWWWVNNLTPVGFVRIYYVNKGVDELNESVALDSMHPVVRLIRGNTFSQLPGFADTAEQGLEDMQLLFSWLQKKVSNPDYKAILQTKEFSLSAYLAIAQVFEQNGLKDKAAIAFRQVSTISPGSAEAEIANAGLHRLMQKEAS